MVDLHTRNITIIGNYKWVNDTDQLTSDIDNKKMIEIKNSAGEVSHLSCTKLELQM